MLVTEAPLIDLPVLAGDDAGRLHAVWWGRGSGEAADAPSAIYYARWEDGAWSVPTDILLGPAGRAATLPNIAVDGEGWVHVTFSAPQLFHSAALADEALDPRAWSLPRDISQGRPVVLPTGLVVGPDGVLHVVYSAQAEEVYHVSSADAGATWSDATAVSTTSADRATGFAGLAVDGVGTLHAVWQEALLPQGHPVLGVLYARSSDGGASWSLPLRLAEADYGEPSIVVDALDRVHVVYAGRAGVGEKLHRYSDDGGLTWSAPHAVIGKGGGLTGRVGLVADAAGQVHLVAGQEAPLYSVWLAGEWSRPESLTAGMATLGYTEQPALALVCGNQLHALFWDGRARLWHTWRSLPLAGCQPELTSASPTPPATETPAPTSTPPPAVAAPLGSAPSGGSSSGTSQRMPLIWGAGAALGVVLLALVASRRGGRKR